MMHAAEIVDGTAERTTGLAVDHLIRGYEMAVSGPISVRTSGQLRSALYDVIDAGDGELTLRLGGAEVWDATGLGVIVGAHHRATQRGRALVIADASPRLVRLIRRTRLAGVMTVRVPAPEMREFAAIA